MRISPYRWKLNLFCTLVRITWVNYKWKIAFLHKVSFLDSKNIVQILVFWLMETWILEKKEPPGGASHFLIQGEEIQTQLPGFHWDTLHNWGFLKAFHHRPQISHKSLSFKSSCQSSVSWFVICHATLSAGGAFVFTKKKFARSDQLLLFAHFIK